MTRDLIKFKQTDMGMVPKDWQFEKLDNFLDRITYGFTCPMPTAQTGPFMITAKDLQGNRINYDNARKTTPRAFKDKLTDKSRPRVNDVLLSKDGTLGRVAVVDENTICINQSVALLRPNDRILSKFLYYLLLAPQYQRRMRVDSDGTVISHIYITRVNMMSVAVPPKEEQARIVNIMVDLDSKIELNLQMKKTLESILEATFKHWFVDFEFPDKEGKPYRSGGGELAYNEEFGDEIPKAWLVRPIDDIADFLNGLALQNYPPNEEKDPLPVIKIRELRQGITQSTDKASRSLPEEYVVHDGDILFSWSGTLEAMIWTSGEGALNQHLFKVTSKDYPKWFYYQWILRYLPEYRRIAEGKATTMGHIQRIHLKSSLVLVPDNEAFKQMGKLQTPIIEKLTQIDLESKMLAHLRDTLLPQLMSGRIRVPVEAR